MYTLHYLFIQFYTHNPIQYPISFRENTYKPTCRDSREQVLKETKTNDSYFSAACDGAVHAWR